MKWTSDMQRPVTLSLIRTSSGPISGTGKSWTSICYNFSMALMIDDEYRWTYSEIRTRIANHAGLTSLGDDRRGLRHVDSLGSRHDCNCV